MAFRAVVGNTWQNITDARVVVGGVAQRPLSMRAVVGGVWKNVWDYDITGPGPVTGFSAEWNNSGTDKAVVTWTQPADVDFSHTVLEVNRSSSQSGPWTTIGSYTAGTYPRGTAVTYNDTNITMSAYTVHSANNTASPIHYYRATPYDALGNPGEVSIVGTTGLYSTVVRGMLSSPYYINPSYSRTWRGSSWRTDATVTDGAGAPERVVQGATFSATNVRSDNYGYYWYDAKRTGIVPTAVEVFLARTDNGLSTASPYMRLSQAPSSTVTAGSNPTGYAEKDLTIGPLLENSLQPTPTTSLFFTVPATWWTDLMDGATWRSIQLATGETTEYSTSGVSRHYLVFYSENDQFGFNLRGGTIRATHFG